jgi:hypothetical protein
MSFNTAAVLLRAPAKSMACRSMRPLPCSTQISMRLKSDVADAQRDALAAAQTGAEATLGRSLVLETGPWRGPKQPGKLARITCGPSLWARSAQPSVTVKKKRNTLGSHFLVACSRLKGADAASCSVGRAVLGCVMVERFSTRNGRAIDGRRRRSSHHDVSKPSLRSNFRPIDIVNTDCDRAFSCSRSCGVNSAMACHERRRGAPCEQISLG